MTLVQSSKRFIEAPFKYEEDFEELIRHQSKVLFGRDSIFMYTKRKLKGAALGASIPDGFLFDLSDLKDPAFYLVEIELQSHDFFKHIFPQITKFFGFFRPASQNELVEKLFSVISADVALKNEFKKFLGEKEIYKFLKDICENSQNILLVIDGDKKELPEIVETYTETWGKLVKTIKVKRFVHDSESLLTVEPDFLDIQYAPDAEVEITEEETDKTSTPVYDEAYHIDSVSDSIKQTYAAINQYLHKNYPQAHLNFQKYYIGIRTDRTLAFMKLRKKKLMVVVMLPEGEVRSIMTHHVVKQLSQPVQAFYNGTCCAVILENIDNIGDFWTLLKSLIR